ncbi:hypothetical protein ASE63_24885 [Bosea sp. Root381]|uniref:hypothetical protein n=1 Tax=Bosea sp. Root381 TaxID=1736524 RepID=UPI0006F9E996|nr:hypothetical protein [Bosea sp. Root381]KRE05008.1 hypothetical protein ASE63_24885 [Bosea sp. Root381]
MKTPSVAITTIVGVEGAVKVDLPLDSGSLNERLFEIGVWLIERNMPHQARVLMDPEHGRIKLSFADAATATAFQDCFGQRLN